MKDFFTAGRFLFGSSLTSCLLAIASQPLAAQGAYSAPSCSAAEQAATRFDDDRASFDVSGYLGNAFDNFAPDEVGGYRNLEAADSVKSRFITGVDVEYRLWRAKNHDFQIWLGAETLHGVRTADVDCAPESPLPVCKGSSVGNPVENRERFLYILEHASSLEAFVYPRIEFLRLRDDAEFPVAAYATGRFGFVAVEGAPKVERADHIGVGLLALSGAFAGSQAEIGWGRSDFFHKNPGWNRMKIDGLLVFNLMPGLRDRMGALGRLGRSIRFFVQMFIDENPGGSGPDSVQSFVGFNFDLGEAFGTGK